MMNNQNLLEAHSLDNPSIRRNTLTFSEAWDEVFERAISKDKLYAEVRAGRIPHTRIGSKIIFRRDTLESWFQEQEIKNCSI